MLLLEQLERQVLADRQVAAAFLAAGAQKVTLPTVEDARSEFYRRLVEVEKPLDPERRVLLEALGVLRAG